MECMSSSVTIVLYKIRVDREFAIECSLKCFDLEIYKNIKPRVKTYEYCDNNELFGSTDEPGLFLLTV